MPDPNTTQRETAKLALDHYTKLSEKIRGWLIIYGISIAALFITQAAMFSKLATSMKLFILGPAFLGVALQILLVISIKYCNLITYKAYFPEEPLAMDSKAHIWAKWWAEAFWIDIVVDVVTIVAYVISTFVLALGLTIASANGENNAPLTRQGVTHEHQENREGGKETRSEVCQKEGRKEEKGQEEESQAKEEVTGIRRTMLFTLFAA